MLFEHMDPVGLVCTLSWPCFQSCEPEMDISVPRAEGVNQPVRGLSQGRDVQNKNLQEPWKGLPRVYHAENNINQHHITSYPESSIMMQNHYVIWIHLYNHVNDEKLKLTWVTKSSGLQCPWCRAFVFGLWEGFCMLYVSNKMSFN